VPVLEGGSVRSLHRCTDAARTKLDLFSMNANVREYVTDAIKFWERWRLIYNLALAAVVMIHFAAGYPASKAGDSESFAGNNLSNTIVHDD